LVSFENLKEGTRPFEAAFFIGLMKSGTRCKGHIKNCKRRGEWSELQFMARAAKEGLRVAKPWGDSSRYDVVVETGGGFVSVQVKSTANRQPNGGYVCGVHPSPGSELYKRGDFDFLAAYIVPDDVWYIIPSEVIFRRKKTSISLLEGSLTSEWAPYREAWGLLRNYRRD
jgi:PD-(D/E)XK endonuclease